MPGGFQVTKTLEQISNNSKTRKVLFGEFVVFVTNGN